jgi:hypothetical protein
MTVSIMMSCSAAAGDGLRLHDMSAGGFLASGITSLEVGGRISGSIHLYSAP